MSIFRSWDELTEKEQLLSTISDVFKDINGWRPRSLYSDEMTVEQLRAALDELYADAEAAVNREQAEREFATREFMQTVATTMDMCNCSFNRAVKFLWDAEEEDIDYMDWTWYLTPAMSAKVQEALAEELESA